VEAVGLFELSAGVGEILGDSHPAGIEERRHRPAHIPAEEIDEESKIYR